MVIAGGKGLVNMTGHAMLAVKNSKYNVATVDVLFCCQ